MNACLYLILIIILHSDLSFTKRNVLRKNGRPKHRHNGNTQESSHVILQFEPEIRRKTKQNNLKKKKHGLALDKANEILSIKDNTKFTQKVFQMMKDDDSDVLKDVDEDEYPFLLQSSNTRHMAVTRLKSYKYSSSHHKKLKHSKKNSKRDKTPKRSQLYNTTIPMTYQNNTYDPSIVYSTNQEQQQSIPEQSTLFPPNEKSESIDSNLNNTLHPTVVATNYQNNTYDPSIVYSTNQEPQQSIPEQSTLSQPIEKLESTDSNLIASSRVCKPGPPLASNIRLPNCLLIGDSITIGYSYAVAEALRGRCIVQASPFSKGGGALDSSYGLECMSLILSTTNLTPTRFDVIIFNFGMHDGDYSGKFQEEFNDKNKYRRNLARIKKILIRTGAGIAYVLTTPIPYDEKKNDLIITYNKIAERVMSKTPSVDTVDLYEYVVDQCGKIPFKNCFMMKKPSDVHYGLAGSILLGKQVAAKIAEILKERNLWVKRGFSLQENANLTKPLFDLKDDSVKCSLNATVPTRCPSETTCVPNIISRSGFACCMLENAVDCHDNFHCCPRDTTCHKNCTMRWCKCILK